MQKGYLLLRHNQQSGPYSLDELIRMSLQPKDLIWVIGQSAGWRYPEEIDALKPFVQGAQQPVASAGAQHAQPSPASKTQGVQKEQAARHIYVSLPTTAVAAPQPATVESTSLSFEERVEKMRQRVAAVDSPKQTPEESEVETKYSRSLEDIKAEYASWMQTQKRKRSSKLSWKRVAIVAIGAVTVISGFWLASLFFSRPTDKALVRNTRIPPEKDFYPTVVMPPAPISESKSSDGKKTDVSPKENKASPKELASKKGGLSQQRAAQADTLVENPETEPLVMADTSNESAMEAQTETPVEKPATVAEQLHINAEYIAGSKKSSGIEGLAVTVKNNSPQTMKVVAVDVIYFKEGMTEVERKTLYFSNLRPGQALTRNAPAHNKAEGAYAQLGLISSEEGSIFYASNK